MSLDPTDLSQSNLKLPDLPAPAPAQPEAAPRARRGGHLIALGMILLLTLLVYMNMG
jgi:hypothetical protein